MELYLLITRETVSALKRTHSIEMINFLKKKIQTKITTTTTKNRKKSIAKTIIKVIFLETLQRGLQMSTLIDTGNNFLVVKSAS